MVKEYTARITSRTKKLGWAYSTTHKDGVFLFPTEPMYVGTIAQICNQIKRDQKTLRPIERWFYSDAIITGIDDGDYASTDPREIDTIIKCLDRKGAIAYLDREPTRSIGRPKKAEKMVTVTITIEKSQLDRLDALEPNRSKSIRSLLDRHLD